MKKSHYLLPALCLLISTQAVAAEKQETKQHGSHEHGVARLTVATSDTGLEIALESPAANLFGFEYKASTAEDKETVHGAIEKLEAGSSLFSMNAAAGCSFDTTAVESSMIDTHHDDHKDEKHEEGHDDHKDEHEDEHDDHKDEKSHSDVDVTWTFKCEQPAAIKSVSTKLFSAFPNGFEELDVEWVTASGAGKVELKKDDTVSLEQ